MNRLRPKLIRFARLTGLAFGLLPLRSLAQSAPPLAFNEALSFSLSFKGIGAAEAFIRFLPGNPQQIEARIDTKTLTSLIFSIHNHYWTEVDPASGLPLVVHKTIDQSNLQQTLDIQYDRTVHLARGGHLGTWPILPGALDLFTMLFKLRQLSPAAGDSIAFPLDIESQAWIASGKVFEGGEVKGPTGRIRARQVVLRFSRRGGAAARAWKTDLLTNRIVRPEGLLTVYLGPPPANLPLLLQFGPSDQRVIMRLKRSQEGK